MTMKPLLIATLIIITFVIITPSIVLSQTKDGLNITVTLTVQGTIDTYDDDPNELTDPLYYIWIDTNGNPNDGGYGNGQGVYQVGIQLGAEWTQTNSPRLHFWGPGQDGIDGTSDDENYYLSDELKEIGYKLAEEAGADYIKTSTGFAGGGATIEDLKLMRKTVSRKVQIKAAGGVRDLDAALKVREVGGTRFGATRTKTIMEECYKRKGINKS